MNHLQCLLPLVESEFFNYFNSLMNEEKQLRKTRKKNDKQSSRFYTREEYDLTETITGRAH